MKVKKKSHSLRDAKLTKVIKSKSRTNSKEESTVQKAVKNVKKIFEKESEKVSTEKIVKRKRRKWTFKSDRGLVYLGHIPHGFYEEQMEQFFLQFGKVTAVRVSRSKKTGNSRGYGYIQFLHPEVAKIAAESMNNYLMYGRLMKATYIPPDKQHAGFLAGKNWTKQKYPALTNRRKVTDIRNGVIDEESHLKYAKKTLKQLSILETKLKEKGIDIKFTPVDVPAILKKKIK